MGRTRTIPLIFATRYPSMQSVDSKALDLAIVHADDQARSYVVREVSKVRVASTHSVHHHLSGLLSLFYQTAAEPMIAH